MDRYYWKLLFSQVIEGWEGFQDACLEDHWTQQALPLHMYQRGQVVEVHLRHFTDGTLTATLLYMYGSSLMLIMLYALPTNVKLEVSTCGSPLMRVEVRKRGRTVNVLSG